MKIFSVANHFTQPPATDNYAEADNKQPFYSFTTSEPVVQTLPETAMLKDGRPFFIPDYADPCSVRPALVLRISRLGRYVSERFARRYYDAVTVGAAFCADRLFERCRRDGLPWDMAIGFDSSAVVGSFLPLGDGKPFVCPDFSMNVGNKTLTIAGNEANLPFSPEAVLAHVSQYSMLRRGDLLFYVLPATPVVVSPDVHIEGFVDGERLLNFNVK